VLGERIKRNIVSFDALLRAAEKARKGKRFRPAVASFHFDQERALWKLHEELTTRTYRPGAYRSFFIHEPKRRQISAAPYRDRVVHHALTNVLEPIFERSFISDSYACRKGKGLKSEDGKKACLTSVCARGDVILERVLSTLAEHLLAEDAVAKLITLAGEAEDEAEKAHEQAEASAVKALEACDARLARARRRLAECEDDLLEDFKATVRDLKEKRAACEAELARLRVEAPRGEEGDAERLTAWLESCKAVCGALAGSPGKQNAVLRKLLKEVLVFPPDNPGKGQTVGKIELVLPEWVSRVVDGTENHPVHHAKSIVLVSLP
jgi:hypothetical protein